MRRPRKCEQPRLGRAGLAVCRAEAVGECLLCGKGFCVEHLVQHMYVGHGLILEGLVDDYQVALERRDS